MLFLLILYSINFVLYMTAFIPFFCFTFEKGLYIKTSTICIRIKIISNVIVTWLSMWSANFIHFFPNTCFKSMHFSTFIWCVHYTYECCFKINTQSGATAKYKLHKYTQKIIEFGIRTGVVSLMTAHLGHYKREWKSIVQWPWVLLVRTTIWH